MTSHFPQPELLPFQSAPLTEARGDQPRWTIGQSATMFQSAPLTEARGDSLLADCCGMGSKFQSAPLTEARGDFAAIGICERTHWFQSAPLTEARGDTATFSKVAKMVSVSIRSPHRSKGRRKMASHRSFNFDRFNPLPSPKQGETKLRAPHIKAQTCFNPLPSPKQGETGRKSGYW